MLVNKLEKLYLVGKSVHSHPSLVFINAIQKHQNYRPFAQVTECIAKNNLSYYLQSHPHTKKKDYGDILNDQAINNSFHERLGSTQCNNCLAITGAIKGKSR